MAKALFFDIDGTLLDSKSDSEEVPEGVVRELKREADLVCGDVSERALELALRDLFPA